MKKSVIFVLVVLTLVSSCAPKGQSANMEKSTESKMTKYAIIETEKGIIKAELYTGKAPVTAKNFIDLANSGFYNGLAFHRVEPGFVVQGGDPKGDGTGGSGKTIPLETSPELRHVKGALAMARSQDPDSASSQFYITLDETPFLDGNYAVFGKVVAGMEAVEKIKVGDRMNKIYISDK
ncbi:peptidylprolyl isomerase [Candidatus Woesearchaeota archaeon]|nr:peptidylprolyl isomerase [Candidatus Woesearchaeota archaeon]